MESKTEIEEDSPVEDTDAMTIDEKSEIEAKVADALEANFETHDMVARAHSGDNRDEESEDEMMQREEEEKSGEGIGSEEKMDIEVGNLELAWQMFELAKVIFSKAGNLTKERSDLETLIYEIKERTSDHKEMQRGTYKEDKDFVPMYNDVKEIVTRKSTIF